MPTPVNVKLLLPPRHSRGISHVFRSRKLYFLGRSIRNSFPLLEDLTLATREVLATMRISSTNLRSWRFQ
jgi:hypothetical protein